MPPNEGDCAPRVDVAVARIPQVQVVTVAPKLGPAGIVYSAAPRVGTTLDKKRYVIKGPDPATVIPEALSTHLLHTVGLPDVRVPSFVAVQVLAENNQDLHFGSTYLETVSPIDVHLPKHKPTAAAIVAADVWLCNKDRNIGNFLLEYSEDVGFSLIAIDFGEAVAAQRGGFLAIASLNSHELWPRGAAATVLGKLPWPEETIQAIERVDESTIRSVATDVALAFPGFNWLDSAVSVLKQRAANIRTLAQKVWHDCNR